MKRKFLILGKACGRRQEEISLVRKFLLVNDWREVKILPKADAVVFFACAGVRYIVDENLREIVEIQKKMKPGAELIVGSCLPAMDGENLRKVFKGKTISPTDPSQLNELANIKVRIEAMPKLWGRDAASQPLNHFWPITAARLRAEGVVLDFLEFMIEYRSTPFLKRTAVCLQRRGTINLSVAAGCSRKCSYCARPFASGKVRSKPIEIIEADIGKGLRLGYRRFNLYADSIGIYGTDLGVNFGHLLDRILGIDKRFSVGLYDVHAQDFIRFFDSIKRLCQSGKVHYLYVAVQSGNERILNLMRRPCDVEDLAVKLIDIRQYKYIFMQSTIIVGFPSETDGEFADTLRLLKRVNFDDVYIHCYCDMPNTEASSLSAKVNKETLRLRLNEIKRVGIHHDPAEAQCEWESNLVGGE